MDGDVHFREPINQACQTTKAKLGAGRRLARPRTISLNSENLNYRAHPSSKNSR
jgi:hypothetical protein